MLEIETTMNPSVSNESGGYNFEPRSQDVVIASKIEKTIFYVYYVFVHIFVFSIFESLFFWIYITKKEDEAIMKQLEEAVLVGELFCENINHNVDLTSIYKYQKDKQEEFNEKVPLNNTIMLNGYLIGVLIACNMLMKLIHMDLLKSNIKILKKQTPMFILLFLYEYLFFSNIVYNYVPNSANKIIKEIFSSCS